MNAVATDNAVRRANAGCLDRLGSGSTGKP